MAIKSEIQGLINSLIRSNPALIDKAEHADVEDALLANNYATVINEKHTTVNIITSKNTSKPLLLYDVFIAKQGRKVTVKGNLVNNSTAIIGGESDYFFEIVNPEYLPSLAVQAVGGAPTLCATFYGYTAKMYFHNNKLCVEALGTGQVLYLNIEYLTEN